MSFAPWSSETDRFLALVLASGLLGMAELAEVCERFRRERCGRADEFVVPSLCAYLVESGRLTQWQCDKLREGRYKGFFLGGHKLVSYLSSDEAFSRYLAEERQTKRPIVIRVWPKDGKPCCEIEATTGEHGK